MTQTMVATRFTRRSATSIVVLVALLAGVAVAEAQPRRLRAARAEALAQARAEDAQAPPEGGAGADPAELARLFDAYTVMQAQEVLALDEAHFGPFVTRLRALQQVRRKNLRDRAGLMREMRQLLQTPGNDAQLKDKLDALVRLDTAFRADQTKAMEAVDDVLDVRQRARFRILEQQIEIRKLELVKRARARQRANRP
jgi:hypothetical protein